MGLSGLILVYGTQHTVNLLTGPAFAARDTHFAATHGLYLGVTYFLGNLGFPT